MKTNTNWTEATQNPFVAMAGLFSCIEAGKNAWIEQQENGAQAFPVKIKNPQLENPFNWTMSYGVPTPPDAQAEYFNETEKDLTLNWTAGFGEKNAVEKYIRTGKLTRAAICGMGTCFPCRKADFLKLRKDLKGWTFENLWTTHWQPVDGIPYHIAAPVGKVFVVCFNDEPLNQSEAIRRASEFLAEVAKGKP